MCEREGVYLGPAAWGRRCAAARRGRPGDRARERRGHRHPGPPRDRSVRHRRCAALPAARWPGRDQPRRSRDPAARHSILPSAGDSSRPSTGNTIQLLDRNSLAPVAQIDAPGADAVAVSDSWLAYRAPAGGGDGIYIRYIANPAAPAPPRSAGERGRRLSAQPPGRGREHPALRDRDPAAAAASSSG